MLSHTKSLPKYIGMTASLQMVLLWLFYNVFYICIQGISFLLPQGWVKLRQGTSMCGFNILTYKRDLGNSLGMSGNWDSSEIAFRVN